MRSSLDVDAPIALCSDFAVDAGAMSDRIAPGEGFGEKCGIGKVGLKECDPGHQANRSVTPVRAPRDHHDLVSGGGKSTGEMAAHETGASRYGYLHAFLFFLCACFLR
jgi:hypothetical protein